MNVTNHRASQWHLLRCKHVELNEPAQMGKSFHERYYGDRGNDPLYQHWYPLMDWQMDRDACKRLIADTGLPVPVKSACFFCPASKSPKLVELSTRYPDLHGRSLALESRYRNGKHYHGNDSRHVQGLGIRFAWGHHTPLAGKLPFYISGDQLYEPTAR